MSTGKGPLVRLILTTAYINHYITPAVVSCSMFLSVCFSILGAIYSWVYMGFGVEP